MSALVTRLMPIWPAPACFTIPRPKPLTMPGLPRTAIHPFLRPPSAR